MNTITLIPMPNGAAVQFPFSMKDQFRCSFPGAKWNAAGKRWEVGPRTIKRLDQWIETVNSSGLLAELDAQENRELDEKELTELYHTCSKARLSLAEEGAKRESAETRKQLIQDAIADLENIRSQIALAESDRRVAEIAAAAEADKMYEIVDQVVSVSEITDCLTEMRRNMKIAKANASKRYDEARSELIAHRNTLRGVGIQSDAINQAISANRNRPDRDYPDLCREMIFGRYEPEEV